MGLVAVQGRERMMMMGMHRRNKLANLPRRKHRNRFLSLTMITVMTFQTTKWMIMMWTSMILSPVSTASNVSLIICPNILAKILLKNQESREIPSESSDTSYTIKRTSDHYYCTCPAWRKQRGPQNLKSCKHIRTLLGTEYESARVGTSTSRPTKPSKSTVPGLLLAEKWNM